MIHELLATAAITIFVGPAAASLQDTGVLRVTVTLVNANGAATPIQRVVMLVSDIPTPVNRVESDRHRESRADQFFFGALRRN